MSLFARIMSHGFALAVVALLAIGLIYRGELFPDMELPAFLQVERLAKDSHEAPAETGRDGQPAQAAAGPAAVDRDAIAAGESPDGTRPAVTQSEAQPADVEPPQADVPPPADMVPPQADIPAPADMAPPQADMPPPADMAPPQADVPAPADVPQPQADVPVPSDVAPSQAGVSPPAYVTPPPAAALTGGGIAPAVPDEAAVAGGQAARSIDAVVPPAVEAPIPAEAPAGSISRAILPTGDDTGTPAAAASAVRTPAAVAPVAVPQADELVRMDSSQTADAQPATRESAVPAAPAAATDMAVPQEQAAAPAAAVAQEQSPYKLLAAAREAYWLRDYATAEQKYQAMIDLDPQNPDGYGELGNMYFSQGKWDRAAEVYFEAGKRLADEGLFRESRQIVDVLRGLQGPQADELEQYIAAKAGEDQ